jgi:hypothetical protein
MSESPDFDAQDGAEALDETTVDEEDRFSEGRTFDELPDVIDLTQAEGDRDEDEALALDADEFDEEAVDDDDTEEDHELDYRAATDEHEDDLDGLGPVDGFNEDALPRRNIEGLGEEVRDANEAQGGEDDFTDFQARDVGDGDLKQMGYAEDRSGETLAKPDRD